MRKSKALPCFHGPWPQCCAHFVFMRTPLISRDGQQQSRGVNSCIRVLIIAVMRWLLARIPLSSHSPAAPAAPTLRLQNHRVTDKKREQCAQAFGLPRQAGAAAA